MAPEVQAVATALSQVVKPEELPALQEQFMDYCTFHLPESVKMSNAVDEYWHTVSKIKDISGEECRFPSLTKLAKATLLIPHGNADTERLFSHVGLNKTKHRNALSLDTLNSLLCIQFNIKRPCEAQYGTSQEMQECSS